MIKEQRIKKGIGSRELSRRVGKAETYVSQLERGLIKNPDYTTASKLFDALDIELEINGVDEISKWYGMKPPKGEKKQNQSNNGDQKGQEPHEVEHFCADQWFNWIKEEREYKNDEIKATLDFLLKKPVPNADRIIDNLHNLITAMRENETMFTFFSKLFSHDYVALEAAKRDEIIRFIDDTFERKESK